MTVVTVLAQDIILSIFLVYVEQCGSDNNQKNHFYNSFKSVANKCAER